MKPSGPPKLKIRKSPIRMNEEIAQDKTLPAPVTNDEIMVVGFQKDKATKPGKACTATGKRKRDSSEESSEMVTATMLSSGEASLVAFYDKNKWIINPNQDTFVGILDGEARGLLLEVSQVTFFCYLPLRAVLTI